MAKLIFIVIYGEISEGNFSIIADSNCIRRKKDMRSLYYRFAYPFLILDNTTRFSEKKELSVR